MDIYIYCDETPNPRVGNPPRHLSGSVPNREPSQEVHQLRKRLLRWAMLVLLFRHKYVVLHQVDHLG